MKRLGRYAVVRLDNGPQQPHTGVVSRHHSPQTAQAAIDLANKRLRRVPGYENARHPYGVIDRETGERVYCMGEWDVRQKELV